MKTGKILVVDDNLGIRRTLEILLPVHFAEVRSLPSPATLVSSLEQFRPDVVLLDMNFNTDINTGNEGLYWAGEIKKMAPEVEVVLFTAYADIALAVEGMKRGAFDFIVKPWDNDKLVEVLAAARDKARKAKGHVIPSAAKESMFWGTSPSMAAIRKTVAKIAPTDATVLITGENGSSAMSRAPSRTRTRTMSASLNRPTAARSSSMKSATSPCICRRSCSAPSRIAASSAWAAPKPSL